LEQKRIEELIEKVEYFSVDGVCSEIKPNGNGNVNDTFVVVLDHNSKSKKFTLQRINHLVFQNPPELMDNFSRVSEAFTDQTGTSLFTGYASKKWSVLPSG
jgi:hypothetical protein